MLCWILETKSNTNVEQGIEVSRHQYVDLWRNDFLEKIPEISCFNHYYIIIVTELKETKQNCQ